jgi:hypothetical protein
MENHLTQREVAEMYYNCSVGSVLNDEVDRMHRAWLKLRPHLTMIRGRVRWGNYREPEKQIKFDEFKLHWDFHKKLQKSCPGADRVAAG